MPIPVTVETKLSGGIGSITFSRGMSCLEKAGLVGVTSFTMEAEGGDIIGFSFARTTKEKLDADMHYLGELVGAHDFELVQDSPEPAPVTPPKKSLLGKLSLKKRRAASTSPTV